MLSKRILKQSYERLSEIVKNTWIKILTRDELMDSEKNYRELNYTS